MSPKNVAMEIDEKEGRKPVGSIMRRWAMEISLRREIGSSKGAKNVNGQRVQWLDWTAQCHET
jgi:hypothetical protein